MAARQGALRLLDVGLGRLTAQEHDPAALLQVVVVVDLEGDVLASGGEIADDRVRVGPDVDRALEKAMKFTGRTTMPSSVAKPSRPTVVVSSRLQHSSGSSFS